MTVNKRKLAGSKEFLVEQLVLGDQSFSREGFLRDMQKTGLP